MSGHSKWKTIQHKKGAADAKRGKIFSRLAKEIMIVAKRGGNPDTNPSLRTLLQKAKASNMPNDNIDRAIKKGTGELEGATYEEVMYEGYAAGGIGVVCMALTDNKNRAAAEIRHVFKKHGSDFAAQGSVSRGFQRRGQIFVSQAKASEDQLMEIVLAAGADDLQPDGDNFEILTEPGAFQAVMDALEKAGIPTESAEVAFVPTTYMPVNDPAVAQSVFKFVEALEENDDVQNVYTNMDVPDDIVAKMDA